MTELVDNETKQYNEVCNYIKQQFGIEPTIESILYLIGIQELGCGFKEFTRDEKMDLINLGTIKMLSLFGFYHENKNVHEDWPLFEIDENKKLPTGTDQEKYIKKGITEYFLKNKLIKQC